MEEGAYTVPSRFIRWLFRTVRFLHGWSRRLSSDLGNDRVAFYFTLEDQRRAHTCSTHQDNEFGIVILLHFCICIVVQRRHEYLVDRFFSYGWNSLGLRGISGLCFRGLLL